MVRRLEFRGIQRFPDRDFRSRILLKESAVFDIIYWRQDWLASREPVTSKPIRKEDIHVETNESPLIPWM